MTRILITLTGVLLATSILPGQERTDWILAQILGRGGGVRVLDEVFDNRIVRGKPFSATEERQSLQILRDGTRIENNQANRLFRDSDGRTRVEEMNGMVTIFDPVANVRTELNPVTKTARRASNAGLPRFFDRLGAQTNRAATQGVTAETNENLKPQIVNGVMAQGVRTTMTIPKGQIGNDREIKVLTERWVSSDLQMLIKSANSDPRFGDTNYQLTGIVEREPDASLFQIPSGYTVVIEPQYFPNLISPGGRGLTPSGGRGPAPSGGRGGRGVPGAVEQQRLLEDSPRKLETDK